MRRRFLLIALVFLAGCSQDRQERRETAKTILLAPVALVGWYLDHQAPTDPKDTIQNAVDLQNSMQPGGYPVTKHLSGDHPDVQ